MLAADKRDEAVTRPFTRSVGQDRSRVYPTPSGIRPPLLASGCMARIRVRDAVASLSWCSWWWQVLGSNQRRLSRRFTVRSDLHHHRVSDLPECRQAVSSAATLSAICPCRGLPAADPRGQPRAPSAQHADLPRPQGWSPEGQMNATTEPGHPRTRLYMRSPGPGPRLPLSRVFAGR